jgi:hypothetical protein
MRLKRFSIAAIVLVIGGAGLRVGVRRLLRVEESSHQSTHPCGALVWRTTTVMRKAHFDAVPVLAREESVVERDGRPILDDVAHFHCGFRGASARNLSMMAAVVVRKDGERANVSVFDASGTLERVVHFAHDVESTSWSRETDAFAAIGPAGEVSVAELGADAAPIVLARGKALLGGVSWSPDGKTACFVIGARPTADPGSAELSCSVVPAPPTSVARAAWNGPDGAAPWVGFDLRSNKPHLCGDGLQPRDVACLGMTRPAD